MASFDLTSYVTPVQNSISDAMTLVEARLELVDNTKNIRGIGFYPHGKECFGWCIYDT